MTRLLSILIAFALWSGCTQSRPNCYIRGTNLTVGLYVPLNGSVYGIQVLNYLSGEKYQSTNEFDVTSRQSITNSVFGCDFSHVQETEIR